MASEYVSAEWIAPAYPGGDPVIKAIGDDGLEYFIASEDSDVPPWPQFIANGGTISPAPEPQPQPYTLPKMELWVRLTDPEAEQVTAAMATQPARMQGIWSSATEVVSNSEFFDDLQAFLTAVLGAERAAEVLAPL